MSCRLMTRQELAEFYQIIGMDGQCMVINGEEIQITSRVVPKPAALEKEKAADES